MALEIEKKFIVCNDSWRNQIERSTKCQQAYLKSGTTTVRVRIMQENAWLTIKGPTHGISRTEFEYSIPLEEAQIMLDQLCENDSHIEKTRHYINCDGMLWELDEFSGQNQGLIMAEIELTKENQQFSMPSWAGLEVSHDKRFYNSSLAGRPFGLWPDSEKNNL